MQLLRADVRSQVHVVSGQEHQFSRVAEKSVHTSTTDVMTSGRKRRNVPKAAVSGAAKRRAYSITRRSARGDQAYSAGSLHGPDGSHRDAGSFSAANFAKPPVGTWRVITLLLRNCHYLRLFVI
jgi:hypothetical protein